VNSDIYYCFLPTGSMQFWMQPLIFLFIL